MTQRFSEDGTLHAVTVIQAGPCTVVQVKTPERDGYEAVQIGFDKAKRLSKPSRGHLKGLGEFRHLREVSSPDFSAIEEGAQVDVGIFEAGEKVDVIGKSKGKGFAGVVKATQLRRRAENPRPVGPAPGPGLSGRRHDARSGYQGLQDGRSHGRRAGYVQELDGAGIRTRAQSYPA